jgi:hypothetical protein
MFALLEVINLLTLLTAKKMLATLILSKNRFFQFFWDILTMGTVLTWNLLCSKLHTLQALHLPASTSRVLGLQACTITAGSTWGCSSVVEHRFSMYENLNSIPTAKKKDESDLYCWLNCRYWTARPLCKVWYFSYNHLFKSHFSLLCHVFL